MSSLLDLPLELLLYIIRMLDKQSRCQCRLTNMTLKNVVDSPQVWQHIDVLLLGVRQYTKQMWQVLRSRHLSQVCLTPINYMSNKVLKVVLTECPTVSKITMPCGVLHAFYFDAKKSNLDLHLERMHVIMNVHHFNTHKCKCVEATRMIKSLKKIHLDVKVPVEESLSLDFFLNISSECHSALKSIHVIYHALPPTNLSANFTMKFATPKLLELLPTVIEQMSDKVLITSAER